MSMSVGSDSGDEDAVMSEINTTPLVDIMLVLLIIFLITSPVVLKLQKINLPTETNQAAKTKPEDVNIVVNKDGDMYWNQKKLANTDELFEFLKSARHVRKSCLLGLQCSPSLIFLLGKLCGKFGKLCGKFVNLKSMLLIFFQ